MAIHPTAIVDPQAEIHETAEIGPYVVIDGQVRIGARTRLMPYVHVDGETTIGEDNVIHMGAVIGHGAQVLGKDLEPGRLTIGNGNTIREYASIHRSFVEGGCTEIGDRCYIMGFSHVGHDCKLGNEVILVNGALLSGHVEVGDNAFISGNCLVHQFVRIGRRTMFQGRAGVGKDVPPFMMVAGVNNVVGINVIGLRRAGFSAQARKEIRQAYKILCRSGLSVPNALARLREGGFGPEVQEIVDFARDSKRGICGFRGRRRGEQDDGEEE
ncbi:acyl-ACP--UDP-N-acetylglucosamine O-acyltransferase [Candidatus Sumerlaeota bacterium]|nr:acyl-ACP--UDP-N-acetylglucosamine O-acyltransferase [Candidatus Sumerlaeota bacterium]